MIQKNKTPIVYINKIMPYLFYLFFALYDGYFWCDDTIGYVTMSETREPLYPLFLFLLRNIFINYDDMYLYIAVIIQSLITAYSVYELSKMFTEKLDLRWYEQTIIIFIMLSVSLLCRFAAKRGSMYSNSILSESIAYPLYLLFFKFVISYTLDDNKKSLLLCSLISFLLISTRKQMYITIVIVFVAILFVSFKNEKMKSGLVRGILICALIFLSSKIFDFGYMRLFKGINSTHTSDNRFITTMIIYVSDDDSDEKIRDIEVRKIFNEIYLKCDKNQYLKKYENGNWYKRFKHFANNYDHIQIDTLWPILQNYASTKLELENKEVEIKVDEINNVIIKNLLGVSWFKIFLTFLDNFLAGIMITVAADKEIFVYYSLFFYMFYCFFILLLIRKKENKELIISFISLFSLLLNVIVVSMVIFCQTRYTIYNMPIIYISLYIMLRKFIIVKKRQNLIEENIQDSISY